MKETDIKCEETCSYFRALLDCERPLNREARNAALMGKEFPNLLKTFCGRCVKTKIANDALDATMERILGRGK